MGELDDALYIAAGGYREGECFVGGAKFASDRSIARLRGQIVRFLEQLEDPETTIRDLLEQLRDE